MTYVLALVAAGLLLVGCEGARTRAQITDDASPTNTTAKVYVGGLTRDPWGPATQAPGGGGLLACNDILAPVSKQKSLPADCVPEGLVELPVEYSYGGTQWLIAEAREAFIEMMDAAARDGFVLVARSSYRSYDEQAELFQTWVELYGEEYARRTSAEAGHSEHQLGTTVDLTSASAGYELEGFDGTPEAGWLAEHAAEFGFVVSYPEGMEPVTGYAYEPWHMRYVGRDVAAELKSSGLTLTEFLQ